MAGSAEPIAAANTRTELVAARGILTESGENPFLAVRSSEADSLIVLFGNDPRKRSGV